MSGVLGATVVEWRGLDARITKTWVSNRRRELLHEAQTGRQNNAMERRKGEGGGRWASPAH